MLREDKDFTQGISPYVFYYPFFLEISDGTITMTVCTLSFPNFGEMARKIQDVEKSQKEFHKDLLRRAPELEKEEFRVCLDPISI